jgi:hypothetical protein
MLHCMFRSPEQRNMPACYSAPASDTLAAPELPWPNPHANRTASTRRIHSDEERLEPCIVEDEFRRSIYIDRRKPASRSARNFLITRTHLLI